MNNLQKNCLFYKTCALTSLFHMLLLTIKISMSLNIILKDNILDI